MSPATVIGTHRRIHGSAGTERERRPSPGAPPRTDSHHAARFTSEPTAGTGAAVDVAGDGFYRASPVKRSRRTNAELDLIDQAIIDSVATEHPVSLRGVFYRVMSAGAIEKTEAGYNVVGRQLIKLRASGRVPYSYITDGTRLMRKPATWSHLDEMLEDAAASYRRALWHDQPAEVIVLSEKDAISGVVLPITARWDVELGITRGYSSVTFAHSLAQTILCNTETGKTTFVYNLGDHDASGVDAWRDLVAKVRGFAPGASAEFVRIAVTEAQIEEHQLPTRPSKSSDSRAKGFAGESVEVDALPASVLREVVEEAITQHLDPDAYDLTMSVEDSERTVLANMVGGLR